MAQFKFGKLKRPEDHSFAWKLLISADTEKVTSSSTIVHEKHEWYSSLSHANDPFREYVMFISVVGPEDQTGCLPYFQQYKLSIVDESFQEMWSSGTVLGSFSSYRFLQSRGMFLPVPSSIMSKVYTRLNAGKECSVKLDFIHEGERKDEETDSERASSSALAYDCIHAPKSLDQTLKTRLSFNVGKKKMKFKSLKTSEKKDKEADSGRASSCAVAYTGKKKDEEADSEKASSCVVAYTDVEALSEAVKELLLDKNDCDTSFSVQGREFKAHKIILKVRSPVFKIMFTNDMLEKKSGRVEIEDCDPDVFAIFLRYLYTGKTDGLMQNNVAPVYHLADRYEVLSLCKICVLFISNNYDIHEFGDFAEIAYLNKENGDLSGAVAFLAKHFNEITVTVKWKLFLQANPEGASEILNEMYQHLTVMQKWSHGQSWP